MKLNNLEKISFGLGGGVNAIKTDFFVFYLGVYYLTIIGLSPLLTGIALFIALIFDAITDPLIGAFSDRLKTKYGRRHLLMALSLIPISLSYILLFIPDTSWAQDEIKLFLWLLCFTILTRFSVTIFDIPHRALAAEIPDTYEDKAKIMSLREGFQSLIALSHSFIILPLLNFSSDSSSWLNVGFIGAFLMFIFGLISIIGTKNLIPNLRTWNEDINSIHNSRWKKLSSELGLVFKNRTLLIFLIGSIFIQIAWGLANSLTLLTNTHFWGLETVQLQQFIIVYFCSTIFSWLITPKLVELFDKKNIVIFSLVIVGLFQSLPFLLYKFGLTPPQGSQELILFLSFPLFLTGTFSLVSLMTREAMIPDVIDAIHLESNIRQDATISSLTSFCAKCMTGFGQFFSGFILWLIAFPREANEPTQTQEEFLAFFQGPMILILFLIPIFIFSYYSITRKKHREIKEGLENS